jgi:hypothetical protein
MAKKSAGEVAGGLIGLLLVASTFYGAWHGVDRHERSWGTGLMMPPLAWYYAVESAWHSDGRREFCGKMAQCGGALRELAAAPPDYDECMRRLDIRLAGETSARQRGFERFANSVNKMTCKDVSAMLAREDGESQNANR